MADAETPRPTAGFGDSCRDEGLSVMGLSFVVYAIPFIFMMWRVPPRRGIGYWERAYTHSVSSKEGFLIELVSAMFSVCSCATYIAGTYLGDNTPTWFTPVEISFSTYFAIQFGVQLVVAPAKIGYIFSIQSLVDVFTVLPVLIATAIGSCGQQFGVFAAARVMKFFRVLRLLRVLRSFELITDSAEDAIRRQTMRLISMVVVILVVTTGFVQYLANDLDQTWLGVPKTCYFESVEICEQFCDEVCTEIGDEATCTFLHAFHSPDTLRCENKMSFHDSLYYTIVTFSTVGYGDVVPVTALSRIAMVFLISVTIYGVPYQVNKLQMLRELRTDFDGTFRPTLGRAFVILCANANVDVRPFVAEFFHEDHSINGISAPQLVLLIDTVPSTELRHTLLKYSVKARLFFVRGDATSATDLGRARADCAHAIFLMADRSAADQDAQDHLTTLRAITSRRTNPEVKIYAQLMQPENKNLILAAGVESRNVMAMNQLRLGLLGLSVGCPGFPTVILNLIQSISWRQSLAVADWHEEYSEGTTMEIYNFRPKEQFEGWGFADLAKHMKKEANTCLIAVAKSGERKAAQSGIFFNPGTSYKIKHDDILFALADEASRLAKFEAVDPMAKQTPMEKASTAIYNLLPEGMAPQDKKGLDLAKPISAIDGAAPPVSRPLSKANNSAVSLPDEMDPVWTMPDPIHGENHQQKHETFDDDDIAPFDGGRGGDTAKPATYKPQDAARTAEGPAEDITPELPGSATPSARGSARGKRNSQTSLESGGKGNSQAGSLHPSKLSAELVEDSQLEREALNMQGSPNAEAGNGTVPNGIMRKDSHPKHTPPPLTMIQNQLAKTSSFSTTPSAVGWWAEANGEGGVSKMPDVGVVNRSLDKLVDSIVDTFGEEGRGMSDNIRSYFKHRLDELLFSTGELDLGDHPKLVDRLVTRLPNTVFGHIIVVCSTLDDMQNFLRPLHQMRRSEPETIVVFITEKFPTTREWIEAAAFPGVYVMMGDNSAGLHRSLTNARVTSAKSVLFCADLAKMAVSNQMADSAVMQGTLQAHALTLKKETVSLVCELTQGGFTRRLAETLHRSGTPSGGVAAAHASTPAAAAKKLKTISMKKIQKGSENAMSTSEEGTTIAGRKISKVTKSDSMLQREEEILNVEARALECQMEAANLMQGFLHLETAFVAGLTVPTSLLDLLVCQQYFNPHMMSLVQQFILGRDGSIDDGGDALGESVMEYRQVTPDYVDLTFGEAFEKMLDDDGTLIIGLYRMWSKNEAEIQNYVYTNPRIRTTLRASDGLYCIPPSVQRFPA